VSAWSATNSARQRVGQTKKKPRCSFTLTTGKTLAIGSRERSPHQTTRKKMATKTYIGCPRCGNANPPRWQYLEDNNIIFTSHCKHCMVVGDDRMIGIAVGLDMPEVVSLILADVPVHLGERDFVNLSFALQNGETLYSFLEKLNG
jgi:hypothetical protein